MLIMDVVKPSVLILVNTVIKESKIKFRILYFDICSIPISK